VSGPRTAASLPRWLCAIGLAAGLSSLAAVPGYMLLLHPLLVLSVGVGGLLVVPAWFAGLGLLLRERGHDPAGV
jgi:hypothetical protein